MRATSIIFRRELGAYLRSPLGYVIVALLLLVCGVLFQSKALGVQGLMSAKVLEGFFWYSSGTTCVLGIALSFRLLAEERQQHTMVLLNTSPVRDTEIIMGKFLAALVFLTIAVLLSLYMPLLVKFKGKITASQVIVGYVGLLLIGGMSLAIGLFASSLTRHQVIAAVIGAAIAGVLYLFNDLAAKLDPPFKKVFSDLGFWEGHFKKGFAQGLLNLGDVVYFVALTYFFLLLATKTLEAKRWQ